MRFFTFSSFSSFGGLEAVAGAADRFQIARVLGVRLDLFADAADVDVDGAGSDVGGIAPDGVEQMIAAENASLVAREIIEQAEFGGGRGNQVSAYGEGHGRRIDFDIADFHRAGRQGTLEAPQHSLDARDEFPRAEGLGDVVVGAEFETEDAVGFAALRGQENYGHGCQAGGLANSAADFESIFAGDHDVEHEESGSLAFGVGEHVGAGGIHADREAFVFEMMADEAGNVRVVFDDEKAGFHGNIVTKPEAST